jgi:hypothetical protein
VTTVKIGAQVAGYPADANVRTSKTEYDWVKGLRTKTIQDPGGLALTQTTRYDSQGRVIKTTLGRLLPVPTVLGHALLRPLHERRDALYRISGMARFERGRCVGVSRV